MAAAGSSSSSPVARRGCGEGCDGDASVARDDGGGNVSEMPSPPLMPHDFPRNTSVRLPAPCLLSISDDGGGGGGGEDDVSIDSPSPRSEGPLPRLAIVRLPPPTPPVSPPPPLLPPPPPPVLPPAPEYVASSRLSRRRRSATSEPQLSNAGPKTASAVQPMISLGYGFRCGNDESRIISVVRRDE